jgi:hypothetical protein
MKPDSVNLLGKNYSIRYVEESYKVGPDSYELLWGYIDHMKREISIYDNNNLEDIFETLLHELIHGVGNLLGVEILNGSTEESELLVNILAVSLADMLVRNDWVNLEESEEIEVDLEEI